MVTQSLAAFAVAARTSPLAADVEHAATRALVDWFAATIPGAPRPAAQYLRLGTDFSGGRGRCELVGGGTSDPRTAALINGTASHIVEMDDIYREGIHHPGSPTVAAALAAAQHEGADGRTLLRAIAVGYELGNRIAAAMQPAHYRYWHTTGTIGTIAAAAAVAEILELDTDRFAHALATSTTMAAGLQQAFRQETMSKPLHAGNAASAGLTAAYAARHGFTGALDVLDGPVGLGVAMSSDVDWDAAVAHLGDPWTVTQPTVKLHACCGHTFAAIDAALELRDELPGDAHIESVHIDTYGVAIEVAGNPRPRTEFEARFSTQFVVATALRHGSVGLESFSDERLGDPELTRMVASTTMAASPEYDAVFPSSRRATVTLTTSAGEFRRERLTRKGDPDDPASDADISAKFRTLAGPVLGDAVTDAALAELWAIADAETVTGLAADRAPEARS